MFQDAGAVLFLCLQQLPTTLSQKQISASADLEKKDQAQKTSRIRIESTRHTCWKTLKEGNPVESDVENEVSCRNI